MSLVKLVFWFKCRKYAEEASPKFLVSLAKLLTKKLLIKRGMRSYKGEWDPDVAKNLDNSKSRGFKDWCSYIGIKYLQRAYRIQEYSSNIPKGWRTY